MVDEVLTTSVVEAWSMKYLRLQWWCRGRSSTYDLRGGAVFGEYTYDFRGGGMVDEVLGDVGGQHVAQDLLVLVL